MENLYEILECDSTCSQEELKQSYKKLALKYHPDKQNQTDDSSVRFVKINKAWNILSNVDLRKEYDSKWTQRCILQEYPIQDTVDIDDFDLDLSDNNYKYSCRCGGFYMISETDLKFNVDLVCCESCSLTVRIVYSDQVSIYIIMDQILHFLYLCHFTV